MVGGSPALVQGMRLRMRVFLKYASFILGFAWLASVFTYPVTYGSADALIPSQSPGSVQRVLLLTAHPDDECMFFGPTISSLLKHSNVVLYSLCLSIGNSEGLGYIRQHELVASLDVLGFPPSRIQVLDHPDLQDNITETWDPDLIAEVVNGFVDQHEINAIVTFDEKGISGHPNHISLPRGVQRLLLEVNIPGNHLHLRRKPLRLFTLTTVPLPQKYTGPLAHLTSKVNHQIYTPGSLLSSFFSFVLEQTDGSGGNEAEDKKDNPSVLDAITCVSNLSAYITALRAMLQHRSQLVWFRWLYVVFSRYMWVNHLVEVPVRHVVVPVAL